MIKKIKKNYRIQSLILIEEKYLLEKFKDIYQYKLSKAYNNNNK